MVERPYVLVSCAVSVDGYIDDAGEARLLLSNDEDLDRVDEVRAGCDAILVGAGTVRRDDPRLLVRSAARREARAARGLPENPIKVTLTGDGDLDQAARFFALGDAEKLVYCARPAVEKTRKVLSDVATLVDAGDPLDLRTVLADLARRGVRRLMVEGGTRTLTQFLTAGLADELHLAIAPFFVGDPAAPRLTGPGSFPHGPADPMRLAEVRRMGDVLLLRYLLGPAHEVVAMTDAAADPTQADRLWLRKAIELSRNCPPSTTAFSVGAIIVDADGVVATGYSRERDPRDHAEEAALTKVAPADPRLAGATLYSSLEPCSSRASRPRSCTELILAAGIRRVVFAWREPAIFVDPRGARNLSDAGVEVVELSDLADRVREINAHLLTS
ncbi:MAG: 5-amino-6-(5-phosphoribosylamino)uracil reductase [Streptosporangiales bacterium]|nr:5-amino-6-(5-phosphoribosylamino)uracil reductase [Streptosporangiales bacterium]